MSLARVLLSLTALVGTPGFAQIQPHSTGGDPHLQQIDYDANQIVQLRGATGYQMMVELSPDEQVQNVALGDSSAWQVSINKSGDRLFLKPMQSDGSTNMTVVTSVRVYNFDLAALSAPSIDTPYTVQFRYPVPKPSTGDSQYVNVSAVALRLSRYRISGDRLLWPTSVGDDGQHTYIIWPKSAPIPAVYAADGLGNEVLVNGMMGPSDIYVLDGAPQRLTFRIDQNVARAVRINPRKGR